MSEADDRFPNAEDTVTAWSAGALHDLLDRDGPQPVDGAPLPVLWHWLAFLPRVRQGDLGRDGHPAIGESLSAVRGLQRMYAGGAVRADGTLRVGEPIGRTSRVGAVRRRPGRTGELSLVTVEHSMAAGDARVTERVDLIYKQPAPPVLRADPEPATGWTWERTVTVDPTLLFRFSALTYNAHRIHYDRDYATGVEGYPSLVVQGPLQAVLLADAIDRAEPGRQLVEFSFRAVAPAFDTDDLQLRLRVGDGPDQLELAAFSGGRRTMVASAALVPGGPA